jgi:hypothetical protein
MSLGAHVLLAGLLTLRPQSGGCMLAGDAGRRMSPAGLDPVADAEGFGANTVLIRCKGLRKGPVSIYIHVSQTPSSFQHPSSSFGPSLFVTEPTVPLAHQSRWPVLPSTTMSSPSALSLPCSMPTTTVPVRAECYRYLILRLTLYRRCCQRMGYLSLFPLGFLPPGYDSRYHLRDGWSHHRRCSYR